MKNKSFWLIKPKVLALSTLATLGIFDALYALTSRANFLECLVGLPLTLFLPGLLALYAFGISKFTAKSFLLSVSISVLGVMLAGLACNYIPEAFGSKMPLNSAAILTSFNVLILLVCGLVLSKAKRLDAYEIPRPGLKKLDVGVLSATTLLVLLGVGGTFRLNNGGSNIVLLWVLFGFALLVITMLMIYAKLKKFTVLAVLFGVGLSVLLMTSLRSWNITGHDIKTEYLVFTLTNNTGKWNIANFRDAYNACLSITILPVVLSKLFHTSGVYVFKFIFQVLFACTPLIIFELVSKYTKSILAFLAAFIYISYPTFTTDSAMLTRQETAFLFFGTIILIWFSHGEEWLKRKWRGLVLALSLGVIFSHYSTTYMYVILLVFAYIFTRFAMVLRKENHSLGEFIISGRFVVIIFLTAFCWYAQTTNVSNNLTSVVRNSLQSLPQLLQQDNRDSNVSNILIGVSVNPTEQLANYVNQTKAESSQDDTSIIGGLGFGNDIMSPSSLAQKLHLGGFSSLIDSLYYTLLPRMYQLLVGVGLVVLLFYKKARRSFAAPTEILILGVAGVIVLALEVILPNISLDYGLMRAFQQCLFFLIIPFMAMFILIGKRVRPTLTVPVVGVFAVLLFAIYSGLAPQLLGGTTAPLTLNNSGPYYGEYYVYGSDVQAFAWVKQNVPSNTKVHASDYHTANAYMPNYPFALTGVLPFQMSNNDAVLLTHEQYVERTDYVIVGGKLLPVSYSTDFLNNKNLVYNNGGSAYYQ